uniref:Regulator of G protein signaling 9 binding protein n=1 Tax=Neogobius melanostomus TaxID=47308 RepID=A0A8C6SX80_9GOBI
MSTPLSSDNSAITNVFHNVWAISRHCRHYLGESSSIPSATFSGVPMFLDCVVACHRHLASCMGGCTDSLQLRDELRQTRERALKLTISICQCLTTTLRDKSLPQEQRQDSELLWVSFSSSLELLHIDMCKVFKMADAFTIADNTLLVLTGLQGGTEVAARALSLQDLDQAESTDSLEQDISRMDHMIDDMESKVNVLRWMVEPQGTLFPVGSTDSMSMALLSVDEECPGPGQTHIFVLILLTVVVMVAATLSVCIVLFT